MLHLSENIKLIRGLSGKTQPEFSILIGENLSNLKTYETKGVMPKLHVQHRIAKIGGVEIEDLLNKKLTPDDIRINLKVEKVEKGVPRFTQPTQISPNSDYKDKYLALLESENLRLKDFVTVSLVELRENVLVAKAMAATNQSLLIEILAKQRKESVDRIVSDANKLFDEFYRNMKARDILPDGSR